jgi:hypothetical protein
LLLAKTEQQVLQRSYYAYYDSEARNTFEHFHDRLPSGKKYHKVREVQAQNAGLRRVLGGLENGAYKFSDKNWDITPHSYQLLEKLVNEFLEKIHCSVNDKCDELLRNA